MANTVTSLVDYEVNQETGEIQQSSSIAEAQSEIQNAIFIARKFPRNEDQAYSSLITSCKRKSFANIASYTYPRGDKEIKGASVYLAREAARLWENIRYGINIISDDKTKRTIEAWAWDVQTNTKITHQDTFEKLIYRKKGGWKTPDERDLRELTNRRGAIAVRNCILQLIPRDMIEDAQAEAFETIKKDISSDPKEAKKKVIKAFAAYNISAEMLAEYLEHSLDTISVDEIADLRTMLQSIKDGNTTWKDYVKKPEENGVAEDTKSKFSTKKPEEVKPEENAVSDFEILLKKISIYKTQIDNAGKHKFTDQEMASIAKDYYREKGYEFSRLPKSDEDWKDLIDWVEKTFEPAA